MEECGAAGRACASVEGGAASSQSGLPRVLGGRLKGWRLMALLCVLGAPILISQEECSNADADGDGWTVPDGDCDDTDAEIHPGATEVCDEVDNDCDGDIDEEVASVYYEDGDGDGYGNPDASQSACTLPEGYADNDEDCDDSDASINPDASEIVNGVDDDCDGSIDNMDGYIDNIIVSVAAGYGHSLALTESGEVWAWGNNWYGQLGDGTTTDRYTPVLVEGLGDVVSIAAGYGHSLAFTESGEVWAWGDNGYGQLGDGTTTDRSIPVLVEGLGDVVSIAAGYYHSLALTASGEAWSWGNNYYGQLGDGTTTDHYTPVQVVSTWD